MALHLVVAAILLHPSCIAPTRATIPADTSRPACVWDSAGTRLELRHLPEYRDPGLDVPSGSRVLGFAAPEKGLPVDTSCRPLTLPPTPLTRWAGVCYARFGEPRHFDPSLVTPVGELEGTTVFVERTQDPSRNATWPGAFYVLSQPDCGFEPYTVLLF